MCRKAWRALISVFWPRLTPPPLILQIQGVGQFPINDRPRVIWAGVQNTRELRALHDAVGKTLQSEGFIRERRRFQPHITLMRFRKPIRRGPASRWLGTHIDFTAEPFRVEQFALYESVLQRWRGLQQAACLPTKS